MSAIEKSFGSSRSGTIFPLRLSQPGDAPPAASLNLSERPKRRIRARVLRGIAVGGGVAWLFGGPMAPAAHAQVLEIDPGGRVTRYAGPTVFTAEGAAPITPPSPRRVVRRPVAAARREDFARAADRAGLSMDLIAAVAWRESRLRADAISPRGALGEMQLMPATARSLGVDPTNAAQNVRGGAIYLAALMRRYDGDLVRALAAYNAGAAAVDRYGGVPPFKETQTYVAAVLDRLSQAVAPEITAPTVRR